ncbi:MAG: phage virion morphogenesis protein [Pseudomonadota bacterium]
MYEIKVEDRGVMDALNRLLARVEDMAPVMREISETLYDETMQNFEDEGRPAWEVLKPSTIKQREKHGYWPGRILQRRGELKAAVHPFYGADHAGVGVAKPYAAIHQFGGQAGRGHKTEIPARPYLPVDVAGNLQAEARDSVLDALNRYLRAGF